MELAVGSSVDNCEMPPASTLTTTTRPIVLRTASIDKLSTVMGEDVHQIGSVVTIQDDRPKESRVATIVGVSFLTFLLGASASSAFYELSKHTSCLNSSTII